MSSHRALSLAVVLTFAALAALLTAAPAFAANQTLKVKVIGPGSVSANEGPISGCEESAGTCEGEYTEGAKVTLTQSHNERTTFAGWLGACSGAGACEVTMSATQEVEAKFTAIAQEELKVEKTGEGAVSGSQPGGEFTAIACGTTCTAEYNKEANIVLTAAAAVDNHFEKWGPGACEGKVDPVCEVEISAAQTAKAIFAPTLHTITVTPSGPGSLSATSPASGITGCEAASCYSARPAPANTRKPQP